MGGIGSGRGYRWDKKTTLEETRRLNVQFLRRKGYLQPGVSGSLSWSVRGRQTGSAEFLTYSERIVLRFFVKGRDGEWELVSQSIPLVETPCNYGGSRKWLVCTKCNRRVGALAHYGRYFYCRHCYGLPHGSKNETPIDRIVRAREKLKALAFDATGYRKKKYIHRKTYAALKERYWQLDDLVDQQLENWSDRLARQRTRRK